MATNSTVHILIVEGFRASTAKAVLVYDEWLPKSMISTVRRCTSSATPGFPIEVPMWLANKKGFASMDYENYNNWYMGDYEICSIEDIPTFK